MVWYLYLSESPFSHFDTVCLTTFSLIASSSCDSPFDFLILLIFSFSIISASLFLIAQFYIQKSRCHKQYILTSAYSRAFHRQISIEQNLCAMACQGCGAVLFLLKAVELLSVFYLLFAKTQSTI